MMIKKTDLRLDKQIGGFDFDFLEFFVEKKEKQFSSLGMRPDLVEFKLGQGRQWI